jgi:hypothetical protein
MNDLNPPSEVSNRTINYFESLPDSAYESIEIYDELPDNRDLIKKIEYSIMFSPFLLV